MAQTGLAKTLDGETSTLQVGMLVLINSGIKFVHLWFTDST